MPRRRAEVLIDLNIDRINIPDEPVDIPATYEGGGGGSGGGGGRRSGVPDWAQRLENILGPRLGPQLVRIVRWVRSLITEIGGLGGIAAVAAVALAGLALSIYTTVKVCQLCWSILVKLAGVLWQGLLGGLKAAAGAVVSFGQAVWNYGVASLKWMVNGAVEVAQALYQLGEKYLKGATAYFADFEQQVASTTAVMGKFGQEGQQTRVQLSGLINEMSRQSRYSGVDIAKSMQEVAKAGYETVDSLTAVTNASRVLSEASLEGLDASTGMLIRTLNQYQMGADQAMRVSNALVAAANKSLASVSSLNEAMKYAGPSAHMFGIGLEETLAALMGMFQMGASGSMAGTQLTNVFNGLIKQTDKAKAAFREYGLDLSQVSPTKMGIIEIVKWFEVLQQRIGKDKTLDVIGRSFELRAVRGLASLLNVGSEKLTQMMKSITGTTDALQVQAEQLNTVQGAWAMLKNLWSSTFVELMQGGPGGGLRDFLTFLRELVTTASKAGVFAYLGQVVGAAFRMIWGALDDAAGAGGGQGIVWQLLWTFRAVAISVVAAVRAMAPWIIQFINWLPTLAQQVGGNLVPALLQLAMTALPLLVQLAQGGLPLVVSILRGLALAVTQMLAQNGSGLVQLFLNWGQALLTIVGLLPTLVPYLGVFLQMILRVPGRIAGFVQNLLPQLLVMVMWLVGSVSQLIGKVREGAETWLPLLYNWFAGMWAQAQPALNGMLSIFNSFFQILSAVAYLLPQITLFAQLLLSPLMMLKMVGDLLLEVLAGSAWWLDKTVGKLLNTDYWGKLSTLFKSLGDMGFKTDAAYFGAGAAAGTVSPALKAAADQGARATNIKVDLAVPPDWDALKSAFGKFADDQAQKQGVRTRTAGPGTGGAMNPWPYGPGTGQTQRSW